MHSRNTSTAKSIQITNWHSRHDSEPLTSNEHVAGIAPIPEAKHAKLNAGRRPLTAKQQRFVEEFLVDLNATAAAKRAGYSERTARVIGYENLTKPDIVDAITKARRRLAEKSQVSVEWVLTELMKIAEANIMNYIKIHPDGSITPIIEEIIRDYGGAIAEYKVKERVIKSAQPGKSRRVIRCFSIKLANRIGALHTLGKYLGMFEARKDAGGAGIPQKRYIIENENESDMDI